MLGGASGGLQSNLLSKAGPNSGSDWVAQGFSWLSLENLQGQRWPSLSGQPVQLPVSGCLQQTPPFPACITARAYSFPNTGLYICPC